MVFSPFNRSCVQSRSTKTISPTILHVCATPQRAHWYCDGRLWRTSPSLWKDEVEFQAALTKELLSTTSVTSELVVDTFGSSATTVFSRTRKRGRSSLASTDEKVSSSDSDSLDHDPSDYDTRRALGIITDESEDDVSGATGDMLGSSD